MAARTLVIAASVCAILLAMSGAAHAQLDVSGSPYSYAGGLLAAPDYLSFAGIVPPGKQFNVHRLDASSVTLGAGSQWKVVDSFTIVDAASPPSSAAYGDIHTIVNDGAGLAYLTANGNVVSESNLEGITANGTGAVAVATANTVARCGASGLVGVLGGQVYSSLDNALTINNPNVGGGVFSFTKG